MQNPYARYAYQGKSREELVVEYAPLVKQIALRLAARLPDNLEREDLIQAGMIGLLDAIEKYDPQREAQFRTYAEFRVKGAMLDDLRASDWIPRSRLPQPAPAPTMGPVFGTVYCIGRSRKFRVARAGRR